MGLCPCSRVAVFGVQLPGLPQRPGALHIRHRSGADISNQYQSKDPYRSVRHQSSFRGWKRVLVSAALMLCRRDRTLLVRKYVEISSRSTSRSAARYQDAIKLGEQGRPKKGENRERKNQDANSNLKKWRSEAHIASTRRHRDLLQDPPDGIAVPLRGDGDDRERSTNHKPQSRIACRCQPTETRGQSRAVPAPAPCAS